MHLHRAISCSRLPSDRTVKIWRARGGLDGTAELADNAEEVASNWRAPPPSLGLMLDGRRRRRLMPLHFDSELLQPTTTPKATPLPLFVAESPDISSLARYFSPVCFVLVHHVVHHSVLSLCRSNVTTDHLYFIREGANWWNTGKLRRLMGCELVCATQLSEFCCFSALEANLMFSREPFPPLNVNVKMTDHQFSLKSVSCLSAPFSDGRPKYVVFAAAVRFPESRHEGWELVTS